jgi:hypothetical protein
MTDPTLVQRLEGAAWLAASLFAYDASAWPWWVFLATLLAPDLLMVGYLAGNTVGAWSYNIGHTLMGPAVLLAWWWSGGPNATLAWGAIWLAHIGMDRALGYGLKLKEGFQHTHLGMIGKHQRA